MRFCGIIEKWINESLKNCEKNIRGLFIRDIPIKILKKINFKKSAKNLEIFFDFKIEDIKFRPKIVIKDIDKHASKKQLELLRQGALDNFIFHLGLMEIPTYWKCVCSPIIEIKAAL